MTQQHSTSKATTPAPVSGRWCLLVRVLPKAHLTIAAKVCETYQPPHAATPCVGDEGKYCQMMCEYGFKETGQPKCVNGKFTPETCERGSHPIYPFHYFLHCDYFIFSCSRECAYMRELWPRESQRAKLRRQGRNFGMPQRHELDHGQLLLSQPRRSSVLAR